MKYFTLAYDLFVAEEEGLREALTSTGNGYFCTRGAAEWEDADGVHYPAALGLARADDTPLLLAAGADLVVTTLDDVDLEALADGRLANKDR